LPPGEINVVDDGSTDDTSQKVAALGDRVRYVRKPNSGKADTLNQSLGLARHPLIWIVDDDDLAMPDGLLTLTRLIDGRLDVGFAYGRHHRFSVDEKTGARETRDWGYWRPVDNDGFLLATLEDFFVHQGSMLVRRSAYQTVGTFSSAYRRSEDYEMLVRLARKFDCAVTDDVIFLQRQHQGVRADSLPAAKMISRWVDEQKQMFSKLHDTLDLSDYLPGGRRIAELTPADRREALVNRGVVMARKKLWSHALGNFRLACRIKDAPNRLASVEHAALRRALFSKYGSTELLTDASISADIRALAKEGPVGREIAHAFARGIIWFVRTNAQGGHFGNALRYTRLAASMALV
jgi:GT2 family glycosyltransferase